MRNIHHQLINSIFIDIDNAIARTKKSPGEIITDLMRLHPEISIFLDDWTALRPEVQTAITTRIKNTLAKMA
ncbi:MAG: hypothetical protein H6Q75_1795 [Firmicutes bacterium]|nr:hypothetical protein [Bacillota bacterium]